MPTLEEIKARQSKGLSFQDIKTRQSAPAPRKRKNIFQKGLEKVDDLRIGFGQGATETILGAGQIGQKILQESPAGRIVEKITGRDRKTFGSKLFQKENVENLRETVLKPENATQRAGKLFERGIEFLLPSSKIAKATKGKNLFVRAGTEAAVGGTQEVLKHEINEEVRTTAGISAAFPVAGAFIKSVGKPIVKGTAKLGPKILSYTSDTSEEAFNILLSRRKQVGQALKEGVTPEKALSNAQGAVRGLRKTLTQEWEDGINALADQFKGRRVGLPQELEKRVTKIVEEFGIDLPQNIKNMSVKELSDLTGELNSLLSKRIIREGKEGVIVRKAWKELRALALRNFGGEEGPLAQFYKNYSGKKGVLDAADDIVDAFRTGEPKRQATALGRLKSLFNENKSAYLDAILDLEQATGQDILSSVAATDIRSVLPRRNAFITAGGGLQQTKGVIERFIQLLALPLTSPRSASLIVRGLASVDDAVSGQPTSAIGKRFFGGDLSDLKGVKNAGLSIDEVAAKVGPVERETILEFTDAVAARKITPELAERAQNVADEIGLGDAAFGSNQKLAEALGEVLEAQRQAGRSRNVRKLIPSRN